MLFVTATKDDRVHSGHARKMAKRFEESDLPFLYYENIEGGYSAAANQTDCVSSNAKRRVFRRGRRGGRLLL